MSALWDYLWRIQEEDERTHKYMDEPVIVHIGYTYQPCSLYRISQITCRKIIFAKPHVLAKHDHHLMTQH